MGIPVEIAARPDALHLLCREIVMIELRVARQDEVGEWEAFAGAHPDGRLFHSVQYVETLKEWNHDCHLLVARRDGALVAGAVIDSRALPGLGWRSANVEGGILMKENTLEMFEPLYLSLIRYLRTNGCVELRLHMRTPRQIERRVVDSSLPLDDLLQRYGARRQDNTTGTYVVSLERDDESLLVSFSRNCRRDVRKAEREGLRIEESEDSTLLGTFYEQHVVTYRRKGLIVPRRGPFIRSTEQALRSGLLRLYAARFEGRIVNMALVSRFGVPMFFKGASVASQLDDRVPPSGQLLHFEIMRRLRDEGFRLYDLGGSPGLDPIEGHPNYTVWRFKRGFGGTFYQDLGQYEVALDRLRQPLVSLARVVHGRLALLRGSIKS